MVCAHCGKGFSCGCQKTRAADGKTVHKTCLTAYSAKMKTPNRMHSTLTRDIERAKKNLNR